MTRTHTVLLTLLLAHGAGCLSDDQVVDETSETTEEVATTVGIERIIPIHYYVLDDFRAPCAPPDWAIYDGIRTANRNWQKAGIQFTVSEIMRTSAAPDFYALSATNTLPYSAVWWELQAIDPSLTSSTGEFVGQSDSSDGWLNRISNRLPRREISVMVPCQDIPGFAARSAFPISPFPHSFKVSAGAVAGPTLAHELGHYFGLKHTMDTDQDSAYDELFGLDAWNNATFFRSAAEVAVYRADWGHRIMKKDGTYADMGWTPPTQNLCWYVDSTTCEMACQWGGRVYRTSTDPDALTGMSQAVSGATRPYNTNVMSYRTCPSNDGPKDLMPSQIERARAALRSTVGLRNQLGRGSTRLGPKRSSTVDFDGDGRRDLAFFRPETSACVVRFSSDGAERSIKITGGDAAKGDQPMPGDYDADGKTDCAVFRPGTTTAGAHWLWTSSRAGYALHDDEWGVAGDIPIADVRLPATFGYGRFAIFRPSTGDIWWKTSATNYNAVWMGATAGDEIVFGDYDLDGQTDLAFWQPKIGSSSQAQLKLSFSRTGFSSVQYFGFGLETDLPIGPVRRDADNQLDFAVWRPSDGNWYYLLNPRSDGSSGYMAVQWGTYGDVPVQGFDFDGDARDDEVVWRAAGTGTTLFIRKSATNTAYALPIGNPGDIPFFGPDSNFDNVPELYLYRPTGQPTGRHFELMSSGLSYPSARTIATSMQYTDIEL